MLLGDGGQENGLMRGGTMAGNMLVNDNGSEENDGLLKSARSAAPDKEIESSSDDEEIDTSE